MKGFFSKIKKFALDILFPISCLSCGQKDSWLCDDCLKKFSVLSSQVCPYCERELTSQGKICSKCKKKFFSKNKFWPLDALVVGAEYKKNRLSRLIHTFKYSFVEDLHIPLGKILIEAIVKNNLALPDIIIPVPLHQRRLRWRGFNQSELLATYIGCNVTPNFDIPILNNLIIRQKYTAPQMKIKNYQERQKNLLRAFSWMSDTPVSGKEVLLVDDICTTGTTLLECAKILKQNGAKKVIGLVLARQEVSKKM